MLLVLLMLHHLVPARAARAGAADQDRVRSGSCEEIMTDGLKGARRSIRSHLVAGLALMLVMEGMMPFLFPAAWRETFQRLIQLSDGQLRFMGITSMVCGLLLLYFVK